MISVRIYDLEGSFISIPIFCHEQEIIGKLVIIDYQSEISLTGLDLIWRSYGKK